MELGGGGGAKNIEMSIKYPWAWHYLSINWFHLVPIRLNIQLLIIIRTLVGNNHINNNNNNNNKIHLTFHTAIHTTVAGIKEFDKYSSTLRRSICLETFSIYFPHFRKNTFVHKHSRQLKGSVLS